MGIKFAITIQSQANIVMIKENKEGSLKVDLKIVKFEKI